MVYTCWECVPCQKLWPVLWEVSVRSALINSSGPPGLLPGSRNFRVHTVLDRQDLSTPSADHRPPELLDQDCVKRISVPTPEYPQWNSYCPICCLKPSVLRIVPILSGYPLMSMVTGPYVSYNQTKVTQIWPALKDNRLYTFWELCLSALKRLHMQQQHWNYPLIYRSVSTRGLVVNFFCL